MPEEQPIQPNSGSGQAPTQNGTEYTLTAVPFHRHTGVDAPKVPFINLDNVPGNYVGAAGQSVVVNSTETGLEFTTITDSSTKTYTAGEDLADADIVCMKPSSTDTIATHDAYVYQNDADTNFGTSTILKTGKDGSGFDYFSFIKWDLSSIPATGNILKAEVILTINAKTGTPPNQSIQRVTSADWDESTITYNNMPTTTDDIATQFGMETSKTAGGVGTTITYDITQLVRHWKAGNKDNYGIRITGSSGSNEGVDYESSESAGGDSVKPILRVYSAVASDGKVYKANCNDYTLCRNIVGIAQAAISTDATGSVQITGQVDNLSGQFTGARLFLDNTSGATASSASGLERVISLGKVTSATEAILNIQDHDILIETFYNGVSFDTGGSGSTTLRFYALSDARWVRIYIREDSTNDQYFIVDVYRDNDGIDSITFGDFDTGATKWTFTWGANYIDITTPGSSVTTSRITNLAFYT